MDELPPFIEVTPTIKGFWCKTWMYFLYTMLTFFPFMAGCYIAYVYDTVLGIAFFLFLTLAFGVIISKMRIASIPPAQREMDYTTLAIVKWYLAKNWCM